MKNKYMKSKAAHRDRAVDLPQHQATQTLTSSKRYIMTAAGGISIVASDIILSGGVVGVSASLSYGFCLAAKLRRVQVWSAVPITTSTSTANVNTLRFTWGGADNSVASPYSVVSDTSLTNSRPLYVDTRPPKGSIPSFWMQNDTGEVLFTINGISSTGAITSAPAGTIIQVDVMYKLYATRTVGASWAPSAAVTTGTTYYPPLDATSTKLCVPVDLPSIV